MPTIQPAAARHFPGQRWVNIAVRTAHLVGVAGLAGGFLYDLGPARWLPFWYLTLSTGITLALLYLWSSPAWLAQMKGAVIVLKVALLGLAAGFPQWRAELFVTVIVLSGLIAHAPGVVRGFPLLPSLLRRE